MRKNALQKIEYQSGSMNKSDLEMNLHSLNKSDQLFFFFNF